MSDVADLLKIVPENGHANKPVRNSMLMTATPLGRSRTNSKSIGDMKKDSTSMDRIDDKLYPPAMELAADLVRLLYLKNFIIFCTSSNFFICRNL